MPSGIVPHGQERPNAGKRHARPRKAVASNVTAFPTLEMIEREWAMNKTLLDIIALARRYIILARMAQDGTDAHVSDLAELDALFTVTAFIACAKLPDTCPEIAGLITKTERLSRLLQGDRGGA